MIIYFKRMWGKMFYTTNKKAGDALPLINQPICVDTNSVDSTQPNCSGNAFYKIPPVLSSGVPPTGLKPATNPEQKGYSIQLSYGGTPNYTPTDDIVKDCRSGRIGVWKSSVRLLTGFLCFASSGVNLWRGTWK